MTTLIALLKAYTQPWTVTLHQVIKLDTDLLYFYCADNEKDAPKALRQVTKEER